MTNICTVLKWSPPDTEEDETPLLAGRGRGQAQWTHGRRTDRVTSGEGGPGEHLAGAPTMWLPGRAGPVNTWQAHRPCDFRGGRAWWTPGRCTDRVTSGEGGRGRARSQCLRPHRLGNGRWRHIYRPQPREAFRENAPSCLLLSYFRGTLALISSKWVRRKLGQEPKSITTTCRVPPGIFQKAWTPVSLWFHVSHMDGYPPAPSFWGVTVLELWELPREEPRPSKQAELMQAVLQTTAPFLVTAFTKGLTVWPFGSSLET